MSETDVIVGAVEKAGGGSTRESRAKESRPFGHSPTQLSSRRAVEYNEVALFENRVIAALSKDRRAEPYRQLKTQVLKALSKQGWRTLAITSAENGEGSTLTATNLALSLAKDGEENVVLVDLDLRNPSIHKLLGLEPERGLADYLSGHLQLEDVLYQALIPRLQLLPGRSAEGYSPSLLSSSRMSELVDDLTRNDPSSLLIFDLPPLLHTDEAMAFAPTVDATLLIIEEGGTTDEDVKQALQLLHDVNVIGTVLNKART